MKNRKLNIFILISLILTIFFILNPFGVEILNARPGGGHSYSGGGSSSGGGGGGDGIGLLIYYIFSVLPPQISIPLVIGVIVLKFYVDKKNSSENQTIVATPGIQATMNRNYVIERSLQQLLSIDPNFSKVLFLDFVASIYNKYYTWFGSENFKNLSPYFDTYELQRSKNLHNKQTVNEIVIGSMRISEINLLQSVTGIAVDIEANYTLNIHGRKTRYAVVERWYFNRKTGIISPEPDKMRKLVCPACAAPVSFTDDGVCESCGTKINAGEMQWFVLKHKILSQEVFSTKGLAHYEEEIGTNLPTIYQHNIQETSMNFARRHNIDWNSWRMQFSQNVVSEYFIKIYNAWSINKLNSVRNLLTDRLYDSFMFWIDAYKTAGLKNKLENINISNVQLVSIDEDKFYESITVRIFASALDYVIDASGKVQGGSDKNPRYFSEYWTFIRRQGVEKDAYDYSTCPNCGAPADKMGQAGVCEYCGTKISNGDFSWVLAIITQDESYTG
ncbi:MAG: zinc-ribbon domain-containing transport protein [Chlorobi bacterium]|nr:zinc-ribbon domain-containing transport protein [Chlorobiota bacterium]